MGTVEIKLHALLILAVDGRECLYLYPGYWNCEERALGTIRIEDWLGHDDKKGDSCAFQLTSPGRAVSGSKISH
jgi:hypothetical protein